MALIYIVEDDSSIREIETIALKNSNHTVCAFEKAKDFYKKMGEMIPDLILLDILLPDENGYEILKKIRSAPMTRRIPVIMVTAKTTELDMIRGLDEGADDYIKKPFSVMELLTRVKVLLRRMDYDKPEVLRVGDLVLDHERHLVYAGERQIDLTYKEYELLRYLMTNPGIVLSRESIMRQVWGTEFEGESRTVDIHINTLRKKLGEESGRIRTVRNVGYSIENKEETS